MAQRVTQAVVEVVALPTTQNVRITQKVVEVIALPTTAQVRVTQVVVEVIVGDLGQVLILSETLSINDAVEILVSFTAVPHLIEITESFALAEGSVKAQRKNAPNIPIIAFDTFGDSFEIVGDFGLQLDTMRDAEFVWDISDVFNLTDAIYSSEYIELSAGSDFVISDEIALEVAAGIEVFDSMQDVWLDEEGNALEEVIVSVEVILEIEVSDALEFSDALEWIRENGREFEDRFALSDSVRVRGEHGLDITGDLIALSDALEVGWNPNVEVSDTLVLDDSDGVSTMLPSKIEIEVGVSDTRLVVTEGLALFDGDFSIQGTEVLLEGTRLSYLRRYLNDVPR